MNEITSQTQIQFTSKTDFCPKSLQKGSSLTQVVNALTDCDLTEEEIRQECETARLEIYEKYYAIK